MKLRIRGNSIRLRVTRSEVERLAAGESISEETRLAPGSGFSYSLGVSDADCLDASMAEQHLAITAPASILRDWAQGEAVSLDCASNANGADILVEKDFACLTPRTGDDDEDTFPHPEAGTKTC